MPKMTLQQRYVAALRQVLGAVEQESKSTKYIKMTRPRYPGTYYFVGKSGAIRYGVNASSSTSASEKFKKDLLDRAAQLVMTK